MKKALVIVPSLALLLTAASCGVEQGTESEYFLLEDAELASESASEETTAENEETNASASTETSDGGISADPVGSENFRWAVQPEIEADDIIVYDGYALDYTSDENYSYTCE